MDFEQEQKFPEPYVIHLDLKSVFRYLWRADKNHVMSWELLGHRLKKLDTYLTLVVLCMAKQESRLKNNDTVILVVYIQHIMHIDSPLSIRTITYMTYGIVTPIVPLRRDSEWLPPRPSPHIVCSIYTI